MNAVARTRRAGGWCGLLVSLAAAGPGSAAEVYYPWQMPAEQRARLEQRTAADHAAMAAQLGITQLRPGRNASTAVGVANAANYDEARANPYPDYPEALVTRAGDRVTSAAQWWAVRRPELLEEFEREVYGRVPRPEPAVEWEVRSSTATEIAGRSVVAQEVVGLVHDPAYPNLAVAIKLAVVLPADRTTPRPVLIMFGSGKRPAEDGGWPAWAGPEPKDPPANEQLIAAGWGYVSLNPWSIQPDYGAGLAEGVIGLTRGGERRRPEDWGALRAWAWGASRVLDFLQTVPGVDSRRVGIEGVSRFGKAALVAMAFDQRFAIALVGSSGEGGVKPHRRNFGEAVENLTSSGAYHWMAGNFLKYGAEEARFGRQDANDLPVDAHELLALCAPRPVFVSYGIPEKGDAPWLDQRGSYMAAVAAGEVYRLLGARDLGDERDYRVAEPPPVNTGRLDGDLAWRQHDGGHEDRSNLRYFLAWAAERLKAGAP